jgi:hypothetical protein
VNISCYLKSTDNVYIRNTFVTVKSALHTVMNNDRQQNSNPVGRCTEMNCPECDELKSTYDKCIAEYTKVRLSQFGLRSPSGPASADQKNQCEGPFQVPNCE